MFLSLELNVPVKEIDAMVMGGHGDTMVPMPRFTKVSGKPLLDLVKEGKISQERLEEINQRTRDGGAEIVKYLNQEHPMKKLVRMKHKNALIDLIKLEMQMEIQAQLN